MLILLSESKTMASQQSPIDAGMFEAHKPVFEEIADDIMMHVSSLSPAEVSEMLGVSLALASKSISLAYEFPNKSMGYQAIFGFTGDAYRGLQAKTLSSKALDIAKNQLRIISSAYGLLSPFNIIKPYRLDFKKPVAARDMTLAQVFKSKNTIELVRYIKNYNVKELINLLPADAEACIDFKILRAFCKVYKVVFQEISTMGKLHTPIAKNLKELRGLMTRLILTENITNFKELISAQSEHFIYSPSDSKSGLPVFIVAQH